MRSVSSVDVLDAYSCCHHNVLLVTVISKYPSENGVGRGRLKQVVNGQRWWSGCRGDRGACAVIGYSRLTARCSSHGGMMVPKSVVKIVQNVELFLFDECKLFAEEHEMVAECVDVAVQPQCHQMTWMTLVDMRQYMQQQPMNLLHRRFKRAWECVTCTHTHTHEHNGHDKLISSTGWWHRKKTATSICGFCAQLHVTYARLDCISDDTEKVDSSICWLILTFLFTKSFPSV